MCCWHVALCMCMCIKLLSLIFANFFNHFLGLLASPDIVNIQIDKAFTSASVYCPVLYHAMPCHAVLCCTMPCHAMLWCVVLCVGEYGQRTERGQPPRWSHAVLQTSHQAQARPSPRLEQLRQCTQRRWWDFFFFYYYYYYYSYILVYFIFFFSILYP